jgi:hypothetical protein
MSVMKAEFPRAFSAKAGKSNDGPPVVPVHVIVASLPNPTVRSLTSDFDRGVEALQRAVQSQGYVVQRYDYPWGRDLGMPGWLLCRRDGNKSLELLLVLVVSEQPTAGFDKTELRAALGHFETIAAWAGAPAKDDLALLGPFYSGSVESLDETLRGWCDADSKPCAGRSLVAVSGSATRRRTKAIVENLKGPFVKSSFYATVLPEELLILGVRRFLKERLSASDERIAELTESSTDYGHAAEATDIGIKIPTPLRLRALMGDNGGEQPRILDNTAATKIGTELTGMFEALSRRDVRHVGILATTTDDKLLIATALRNSAPNLRLHTYEGSLAAYETTVDPTTNKKRDKGSLDGIVVASSYPLFPATQLWNPASKRSLVQFPTMAAEGMYNAALALLSELDPKLKNDLSGLLRDYTSPFCPGPIVGPSAWMSVSIAGQLWPLTAYPPSSFKTIADSICNSGPADPYVFQPPSRSAELKPTAAINVLTYVGSVLVLILLIGTAAGSFSGRLIGRDAYLRVLFTSFDPGGRIEAGGKVDAVVFPTTPWGRLLAIVAVLALVITGLTMGKILSLPRHFTTIAPFDNEACLGGILQGAAAVVLPLTFIAFVVARGKDVAMKALPSAPPARAGAAAMPTADANGPTKAEGNKSSNQNRIWWLAPILAVAIMIFGIAYFPKGELTERPDGHAFLFYVRAMDPSVGLTPTIPLFMSGMAVYIACLLLLSVERRATKLRSLAEDWAMAGTDADKAGKHSLGDCAEEIRKFAAHASQPLWLPCLVGTICGAGLLGPWSPLRLGSLEGEGFDIACSLIFSIVFSLALASAWRAHVLWYRLRDFTRALAIHPAAKALNRLPLSVAMRFRSPVPGRVSDRHIGVAIAMSARALGSDVVPTISILRSDLQTYWFPLANNATPSVQIPGMPVPVTAESLKEDIVVLSMANVLGVMCDATRTMLFAATGAGLVALLACALYPFQPAAALTGAGIITVSLVAVVALRLLLGIERDEVLSGVARTTAGTVTASLGLAARLLGYVVVPITSLVASRLPNTGSALDAFKQFTNLLNR